MVTNVMMLYVRRAYILHDKLLPAFSLGSRFQNIFTTRRLMQPSKSLSSASTGGETSNKHDDTQALPQSLNVLQDANKLRINQLTLKRLEPVGMKPATVKSIREFEVVNVKALNEDNKLLFIRLYHAKAVEKYVMRIYAYEPNPMKVKSEMPCLVQTLLERNAIYRTIAARIYSPPGKRIGYVYDLEGVHRTAIIEDGQGKCIYQLHTRNQTGWMSDAIMYSRDGTKRLGHVRKLEEGYHRNLTLYLKLHESMTVQSKCCMISAAIFLMSYGYVR